MIAPLRTEKKPPTSRRMKVARAMIAAMLLPSEAPAPLIAAWKAWIFVAWVSLMLGAYAFSIAGPILHGAG